MDGRELLFKLSDGFGVSGHEYNLYPILEEYFREYVDEIMYGKLGDFIGVKKGDGDFKIMIAAHADEVGLVVTDIDERGFVHFRTIRSVDEKTLPAQEVMIQGKSMVYGVIGAKPPHVLSEEERKTAIDARDMVIDTGMDRSKLVEIIAPGDFIAVKRSCTSLLGDFITGKALDDRAGICAMFECAKYLKGMKHASDVYFTATVMEETGHIGAKTTAYKLNPDIGIAIDVTSADKYANSDILMECGKGIKIAVGPNIHPELAERIMKTADKNGIPYKIVAEPGATQTDAWEIQTTREGIPTLLLSIPLRYMHTSVEVISYSDVEKLGRLLALFITGIRDWGDIYA